MSESAKKGALYDDILTAPADKIAEIVEGDLYLSPRPSPRHTNASSSLGADLHDAFHRGRRGPGGWWILDEPELHLAADVLVPDLAGWRRERLSELPEIGWFELAPDWLCEVVSPSTERIDRTRKLPRYAAAGVPYASLRSLEVLQLQGGVLRLHGAHYGAVAVSAPPFEAVTIELGPLWV